MRRLSVIGALIVVAAVGLAGLASLRAGEQDTPVSSRTSAAPLAPDVALLSTDGQFRLSDMQGKVVLLYFSFPG